MARKDGQILCQTFCWLFSLGLLAALPACSEKKSAATDTPQSTGGDGGDGGDDGGDGSFDLCKDGLQKADLSAFSSYIKQLCESGKLATLRESDNVYTGDAAKVFADNVEKGDTETSIRLYTSALADTSVTDYWALMQLQLKNPEAYRDNFDYDVSSNVSEREVDGDEVKYRYAYDSGNGGACDYRATTTFITLKSGQAYVSATTHDETIETMKDIKALIIINKKSDKKTEVFTMSDQTYSHAENQADATEDEALTKAREEQKRMFKNAKEADQAPDLLTE